MALKFDAVSFDTSDQGSFNIIRIGFNLVDDAVLDGNGKPTIQASTSVESTVPKSATATAAKSQIASDCVNILQDWYNKWNTKNSTIVTLLTSNEAALETYVNSHVAF